MLRAFVLALRVRGLFSTSGAGFALLAAAVIGLLGWLVARWMRGRTRALVRDVAEARDKRLNAASRRDEASAREVEDDAIARLREHTESSRKLQDLRVALESRARELAPELLVPRAKKAGVLG